MASLSWDVSLNTLYIEITTRCNFNCIFCARNYRSDCGNMSFDLYRNIIQQAIDCGIRSIRLTPLIGELFSHPIASSFLAYLDTVDIEQFGFYTNFSLLSKGTLTRLSGLKKLKDVVISVNGSDQSEFEALTRSSYYHRFLSNLYCLDETLSNIVSFEIKSSLEFSSQWIKTELFRTIYKYHHELDIPWYQETKLSNWAGFVRSNISKNMLYYKKKEPCKVLVDKNIVLWNGDFQLCGCRDIAHFTKIGNIIVNPLSELLRIKDDVISLVEVCNRCTGQ